MKVKVVRPQAYVVLANLRYAEASAKPLGPQGKLSAKQAASIIEPLQSALQNAPTPNVFNLLVETWAHCALKPTKRDVEDIANGIGLYPRDVGLAYISAAVCANGGYTSRAVDLIDKGLIFTPPGNLRDDFEQLRSKLVVSEVPDTK